MEDLPAPRNSSVDRPSHTPEFACQWKLTKGVIAATGRLHEQDSRLADTPRDHSCESHTKKLVICQGFQLFLDHSTTGLAMRCSVSSRLVCQNRHGSLPSAI